MRVRFRRVAAIVVAVLVGGLGLTGAAAGGTPDPLRFTVSFDRGVRAAPVDGRLLVVVTRDGASAPVDQLDIVGGVPFWGRDVTGMRPNRPVAMTGGAGYPVANLRDLPAGRYHVQAFLNTYDTFHRGDGSTVRLHMPCGDGQNMFASPGNLIGTPVTRDLDPRRSGSVALHLDRAIAPATPVPPGGTCQQGNPPDTAHVRHVTMLSPSLSRFWGRPMYIAATVLLPAGYDDAAEAATRYPVEYAFGHFGTGAPHGFREDGGNAFSAWWLASSAPRFIVVSFREENPFYDSSYVVDSPNVGPYGTATNRELLPLLDKRFRTIGQPWARVTAGGSTGGWEALASLVFYPDVYGGTFAGYPDPVDFRRHQLVDIYSDANAYYSRDEWDSELRPDSRSVDGEINYTNRDENLYELALGDRDRSTGSWAMWEAVYGPRGADGYPAPVWDKRTGVIDHAVAARWRGKDLSAYLDANWGRLGSRLAGEIHVYVGDLDTYYLNDAVELLQQRLATETAPAADATFVYGRAQPHGWSPYTAQQWFAVYADYLAGRAPRGTDTSAWRGHQAAPAGDPARRVGVVVPDPARGATGDR